MSEATPAPISANIAGTDLLLLESGTERLEVLLDLLDGAATSVRFLFYMMNPDAAGEAVRDALVRAARRGVEVRVLLDGFGSDVNAAFLQPLVEAGGAFILFHPKLSRRYLLRNHQKIVVVDERLALIGGANIDRHYLSDHDLQRWRDLWLRLDGAAVQHLARYYDAIYRWSSHEGSRLRDLRRIVRRYSQHKGALQWKLSGPVARHNPWPGQLAREIIAGTRLDVISAYFSPPFAMLRRIGRLGRRGQVRIVTAARSDNNATIAAARHTYARLLRHRVGMYEYQPAKLHTKLVICDDVVHLGSSNLDFRSLYLNLEIMLRIDDAGFAAQLRGYFERELVDCQQITPAIHRARAGWLRRLKWTISHWLVTAVDYTVTRRLNFRAEQ
ncbi:MULTISPECIES: phospholipase D-like domain-containing protein [Sphingomonas]|uniref:phospholipase D-like domain-containing protein n=1 Tax=Sphingomonas TaxID=13687 RepID=UPI000DEF53F6|nr:MULTISPECIES: phosphatidylserine/phosphatidylglycerophosphate/cardiolipin synthase family protein [Sphingomonas]